MVNALELFENFKNNQAKRALIEEQLRLSPLREEVLRFGLAKDRAAMERDDVRLGMLSRKQDADERFNQGRLGLMAQANSQKAAPPIRGVMTADGYMSVEDAIKNKAKPPSMSQSSVKERLSDEAVRDLAVQSLYDSGVLAGYRRDTEAMSRIGNSRMQVMKESGVKSEDVVSGRAGFMADRASLNKITPQYDAITAFENTAKRNGKILVDLAKKVDTTGVPAIERWVRAGRQELGGDADVAKFNAQMNAYRAEVARILTQPTLSGVLSDTAREEAKEFLKGSATPKQVEEVVGLLERDFDNRKSTLELQIQDIRRRMGGRMAPGDAQSPSAPQVTPPTNASTKLSPEEQKELDELRRRFGKRP